MKDEGAERAGDFPAGKLIAKGAIDVPTNTATPATPAGRLGSRGSAESRKWWTLAAVSLAAFMTYLDNNIINVAIPTIQRDLNLSVSGLEWVVSSYLLTLAGLLLVGGRLADVLGRRRLFLAGMALFTLSSLAAGLADSGAVLIASRAVQGVGAAMLMPTTLAIIMATFHNPGSAIPRSASGPRSARSRWRSARCSAA